MLILQEVPLFNGTKSLLACVLNMGKQVDAWHADGMLGITSAVVV